MKNLSILVPTCERLHSLIFTLSGIAGQRLSVFRLIVAEQSRETAQTVPVVRSLLRIIESRGAEVAWHHRPQVHGIAEQREFLLNRTDSGLVLFLDDDVFMEPWVTERLADTLRKERCGFVGAFPSGLSFRDDVRPDQQFVEFWEGPVRPEAIGPGTPEWRRADLHRAANLWHVARSLAPGIHRLYKVAWVASCSLYDRKKLLEIGGFSFWKRLPRYHSGEDVLAQNLLMRRWGGCAIMPSGTYHAEVPSTVLNEAGRVDGHALDLLPEMIEKYARRQGS